MPYQHNRANFPKDSEGNLSCPAFRQLVDAAGNLAVPDNGLTPQGGTAVGASSGDVANATAAASLAAGGGTTMNYITGFEIVGTGATAAGAVVATITGLAGGTMSYPVAAVAGASAANPIVSVQFAPPHPASAVNTAITVSCPALGAGNLHNCVNVRGVRV